MKKNIAIVLLFVLAACTNESDPAPNPGGGKPVTIAATTRQPQTRVNLTDNLEGLTGGRVDITWKEGDSFKVYTITDFGMPDLENPSIFTLVGGAGSVDGIFTGILPEGELEDMIAVYPDFEVDFTTQVQVNNATLDHLGNYHLMGGSVVESGGVYSIQFFISSVLIKFDLTLPTALAEGEALESLTFGSDLEDWLVLSVSMTTGPILGNSLTLGLRDVRPIDNNKITAYMMLSPDEIVLPAGTNLTVTLKTNQHVHTFTTQLAEEMEYTPADVFTAIVDTWTSVSKN